MAVTATHTQHIHIIICMYYVISPCTSQSTVRQHFLPVTDDSEIDNWQLKQYMMMGIPYLRILTLKSYSIPCCGTMQSCTANGCTIYYNYLRTAKFLSKVTSSSIIKSLHCSGQVTHHQRWSTGSCARQMQDPTNAGPERYWQQMLPTSPTHFSQISRA